MLSSSDKSDVNTNDTQLAQRLHEAGTALSVNLDTKQLREVERFLWDWKSDGASDEVRFLVYFIRTFIDKVVYNLSGDVPYKKDVTPQIQTNFYKNSGESLISLAECLSENRLHESFGFFIQLGTAYWDAIESLNDNL